MLAFLGLATILLMLILVMTKKVSPMVALVAVPVVLAILGGFRMEIFRFMSDGILSIAPTAVMFIFAILFFGILLDVGTFQPIISWCLKQAGSDPVRITIFTAILAMLVHLDGSGAITFLITIPALLPLYDKLGMQRGTLATVVALAAGTMNILPWGGPTIRAATVLKIPVTELFNPMLVPFISGLIMVLIISLWLGLKERKRCKWKETELLIEKKEEGKPDKRSWKWYINMVLVILTVLGLTSAFAPPHILFILSFIIAISINYPVLDKQKDRIDSHAKAAMLMAGVLIAAGCFMGILKGTGMLDAMAAATVKHIPDWIGKHLAFATGLSSMPASLLFDPDSFYFGILPVISSTASHFGGDPVEVGRAAILGQMTTGFPVSPLTGSTFLLVGLAGIDLGDHQRRTIPLAFLVSMVILFVSIIIGVIRF